MGSHASACGVTGCQSSLAPAVHVGNTGYQFREHSTPTVREQHPWLGKTRCLSWRNLADRPLHT